MRAGMVEGEVAWLGEKALRLRVTGGTCDLAPDALLELAYDTERAARLHVGERVALSVVLQGATCRRCGETILFPVVAGSSGLDRRLAEREAQFTIEGCSKCRGKGNNPELLALFEADQADRHGTLPQDLAARDGARRGRVEQLITAMALHTGDDYFHAAMVFQHGATLDDYWRAHELATQGAALGHTTARWLVAAAYDRWLMCQGKPQKYGTQYVSENGHMRLYEVDAATTDAERAAWNVPPLAEARAREAELTKRHRARLETREE